MAVVLRVRKGDRVVCLDGLGRLAEAEVLQSSSREILLRLGPGRQIPPPDCSITLAAAVPGQGKLDPMVSEATQMGAAGILPLITERTVARWAGSPAARKQDHLRQVALEAMKQSGAPRLPVVGPVTAWADLLPSFPQNDLVLMAAVEGPHEPLRPLLAEKRPRRLLLLIGPEGDFSSAEIAQAVAAGARRISLGPQVLRCETAVVAALAVIRFVLRESDPRIREDDVS